MVVIKRNGAEVPFDATKISNAIQKAGGEEELSKDVAQIIYNLLNELRDKVTIEEIQDLVENLLMNSDNTEIARKYIRYRYKKEAARNYQHDFIDAIREKLNGTNIENQNANVDERSFGGRIGEASSVMTKKLALDYLLSKKARYNHENNRIYEHDLDAFYTGAHNCLSVPFDDLLAKGFNTRQTDVRPAGSVSTACQLVAVIFQLQSLQQFGGVSATHIDWTMIPYIRKSFYKHYMVGLKYVAKWDQGSIDSEKNSRRKNYLNCSISDTDFYEISSAYNYAMDMTEREVHQAVEALLHNLNTLQSRSGNQLPFTSLNYGTCTLPEGRMFTRALLDVSIEGMGAHHKTSVFPCGIFQCMKDVNRKPGNPNYDLFQLALESTAKRLYPNYANVDWSGNEGYDRNDPTTYFSTINNLVA